MKIGLYFNPSDKWIAESYYYLNAIRTLNVLPENEKPHLIVFCPDEKNNFHLKETGYSKLKIFNNDDTLNFSLPEKVFRKLKGIAGGKNFSKGFAEQGAKAVYISYGSLVSLNYLLTGNPAKKIWIPDLQEVHFPQFFTDQDIKFREELQVKLIADKHHLIFSSESSKNDFTSKYPSAENKINIYRFSSIVPDVHPYNKPELLEKFGITKPFYIAPNQFWQHKNQLTVLKALDLLDNSSPDFQVLFTGKPVDYRNQEYSQELAQRISQHERTGRVKLLGFIDRLDLLRLIDASSAVIQPSLFEGWSTVVEDAKALGKEIILSDIPVHREQVPVNPLFFNPDDPGGLARILKEKNPVELRRVNYNYAEQIKRSAKEFMNIFQ